MNEKYEKSRNEFESLNSWFKAGNKQSRNEATTRLHLINNIIFKCLGWEPNDVTAEDAHEGVYTDYTFRLPRPVAILEAKREGIYFELPEGTKSIIYNLAPLLRDNKEFKAAINQVCSYCQTRGVEIGIVSNGWQIVALIANRNDGIPVYDGQALVFRSLDEILNNFQVFWDLLSKSAFEKKNLQRKLLGNTIPELPPKLSTSIKHYPGIKNRNTFQTNLQILSELILEDVLRYENLEKTFLEECYCSAGALSHYSSVSREILKTRYENLFEKNEKPINIKSAVTKSGVSDEFKDIAAHSISRRPILLIGDVGVGKTSFINNLINVEAAEVFKNCLTFKIDLGTQFVIAIDIREAIIDEIIKQLFEVYHIDIYENGMVRGIYHSEYEKFKRGIYKPYFDDNHEKAIEKSIEFFEEKQKNKSEHLKNALLHIAKARKKQAVIFIDNCDQRDYNTQQTAFLISQEFAENWHPVTVFVSLRPETFHQSLQKGSLSGYHPKAFTIAPPRVDLVIQKRLYFAMKIANGDIPIAKLSGAVSVQLGSLRELINVMIYSFDKNDALYRFIENITNGNVRLAIDLVKNFLGSGHVDTQKILDRNTSNNPYIISLHEFVRAVIFGDNVYYDPETSHIFNIFDVHYPDKKEHFLSVIMLSILDSKMNSGKDNGFVETIKVSNHLQGLGFSLDQIDGSMNHLISKNLIETSKKGAAFAKDEIPVSLRLTTTGAYHLKNLSGMFAYVDAMLVDTPYFDDEVRSEIQDTEYDIDKRLVRTKAFIKYLDDIWSEIDSSTAFYNWTEAKVPLIKDIDKVAGKRF